VWRDEPYIGGALLAIAHKRIARDGAAEEDEVVEARQPALGAEAANLVEPLVGGAVDLRQHLRREGGGGPEPPWIDGHVKGFPGMPLAALNRRRRDRRGSYRACGRGRNGGSGPGRP